MTNLPSFSIDDDALVAFTQDLVRCQSWNPPGGEAGVAELVVERLRELGLEVETEEVDPGR